MVAPFASSGPSPPDAALRQQRERAAAIAAAAAAHAAKAAAAAARAAGNLSAAATLVSAAVACRAAGAVLQPSRPELALRGAAVDADLDRKIDARERGAEPELSGHERARRNVAVHAGIGAGADATSAALAKPQRAQRAGMAG